jgi:hypothetical protein
MVGHTPHPLLLTQEGHIYLSISTQKKDLGQSPERPRLLVLRTFTIPTVEFIRNLNFTLRTQFFHTAHGKKT